MSAYCQIDIRILPFYGQGGLAGAFPSLAKLLEQYRYTLVLQQEPSLYNLVEVLTRIKKDPVVPEAVKRPITKMEPQLVAIRDEARGHLLSRHLNELDKTLYRLEDLFKELEGQLA